MKATLTVTNLQKGMTWGNPMRQILMFSLPLLAGNFLQQMYNMVDSMIVGQFGSAGVEYPYPGVADSHYSPSAEE